MYFLSENKDTFAMRCLLYYSSNPGLSDDVDWIRSDLADFDLGDLRLLEALTLGKLLSRPLTYD